jgi:hypothetical protein
LWWLKPDTEKPGKPGSAENDNYRPDNPP